MVIGFKDLPAPPHVHDASNHAFMVARAAELGSLDPSRIFAELLPHKVYLSGWHLAAAITGSLAGVAPYIATWFTAITCVALVPIALATLWWRWGVGAAVAVAGTFWVMTNSDTPAGNPFSWGGLGVHVGFFIAPLGAITLAQAIRSRRPLLAFAAGLYLAATIHMHFSEVVIIPLLAILTVVMQRRQVPVVPVARWWPAAALFGLGLALAFVPAMVEGAGRYASDIGGIRSNVETVGLVRALRSFPQGIGPPDLRFPWAVGGTILMLSVRRWRPIAVASVILGFWIFALKFWYDPVSRVLATPYYGQVARISYQQMYLMPLAAGAATVMLIRFAARRNRVLAGAACVLAATTMVLGYAKHHRNLASLENKIPFDQQEYLLAREIGEFVPDGEVVANYRDDGSTWAWHVSGQGFSQSTVLEMHCSGRS